MIQTSLGALRVVVLRVASKDPVQEVVYRARV